MKVWPHLLLFVATTAHGSDIPAVIAGARDTVVTIETLDERGDIEGIGSGVVIAEDAILTNCHVVAHADAIRVAHRARSYPASLAREDARNDLCLLRVEALPANPASVKPYAELQVGDRVFAVGNPLGLGVAVSTGLITVLAPPESKTVRIHTTAAVSPGSSGGGLFDEKGRLVGITTLMVGPGQNFNLVMPAELAADLVTRGTAPVKRPPPGDPDPDWRTHADGLRMASDWPALEAWAKRMQEAYPDWPIATAHLALAWINTGRAAAARDLLRKAIALHPRDTHLRSYLGMAYLRLAQPEAALAELQQVIELQPSHAHSYLLMAEIHLDRNHPEAALKAINEALRFASPSLPEAWRVLGNIQMKRGKPAEAIDAFRAAVGIAPQNAQYRSALAFILAEAKQTEAARKELAAIKNPSPQDANAWVVLGISEDALGRLAEAEQAYRKALETDPENFHAWHNLGLIAHKRGDFAAAREALHKAKRLKPQSVDAWLALSLLEMASGNRGPAFQAAKKATEVDAGFVKAWLLYAGMLAEDRQYDDAIIAYEKLVRLEPQVANHQAMLGQMKLRVGRAAEAHPHFQQAEKLDPDNENLALGMISYHGQRQEHGLALEYAERLLKRNPASVSGWISKGYALIQLRRFQQADAATHTALRLQPDSITALINLGESLLHQKQLAKSIQVLERALALAPKSVDARLYLAQAYAEARQFDKAQQQARMITWQAPAFAPAWALLTLTYVAQGNHPEALEAFARLKQINPAAAAELSRRGAAANPPFRLP